MRVLSIEIGVDLTHVIEVDYKTKNPKIYQHFTFQTSFGMIGDSGVRKNEEFRKNLHKNLNAKHIKTRKAICVITSGKIANREIEIPYVKDNRIRELLNTNSAEYFPVDLAQYQLVYRTIASPELQKAKKRKLFVLAVPNELINSYVEFSSFCNLELVGLDYVGNSIYQNMKRTAGPNFSCTIKIDENATMITIINKGQMELQRTIFYGIGEASSIVEESTLFREKDYDSYDSVKEMMSREKCVKPHLNEKAKADNPQLAELQDEVTESLRPMIGNISRVFDYYTSRNAGVELKECILIGNGADTMGLPILMQNELNVPVIPMTVERSGVNVSKGVAINEYIACHGAAIAPFEFSFGDKQPGEVSRIKRTQEVFATRLIFCLCGLAAVGLVAYSLITHFFLDKSVDLLKAEKNKLAYIEEIYNNYLSVGNQYADVKTMFNYTNTTNDKLADAITEMEAKLPSSIRITSLTADGLGITMEVNVTSKNEAAKVLEQLRTFEIFRDVETEGLSEVTDEEGKTTVVMTVMCTYIGSEGQATENSTETSDQELLLDIDAVTANENQGE